MDLFSSQYKLLSEPLKALHDSTAIADTLEKHPSMQDRALRRAVMVLVSDILVGIVSRQELKNRAETILQSNRFLNSLVELIEKEIIGTHAPEVDSLHEKYLKSVGTTTTPPSDQGSVLDATSAPSDSRVNVGHVIQPTALPSPIHSTTPHIQPSRVMPQSAAEVAHDPKGTTELPNALLQNLKASLMHGGAPEEPLDGTGPKAAYTTMLNSTSRPPQQPG
jgi:hypothetical protein